MALTYDVLVLGRDCPYSLKNWCNHDRIPSEMIIDEAEQWIYQRLRVRAAQKTATGTLVINTDTITLPTDYRAGKFFKFTGVNSSNPVRRTLDEVIEVFSYNGDGTRTTGRPTIWATDDANIQFEVLAFTNYTYLFRYYAALAALSPTNKTNVLLTKYLTLFRTVCLAKAWQWRQNRQEMADNLQLAMAEIEDIHREDDQELEGADILIEVDGQF